MMNNSAHGAFHRLRTLLKTNRVRAVGVVVAVFVLFAIPHGGAGAGFGQSVTDGFLSLISSGLYWLAYAFGKLTVVLFGALVQVMQYNDFINARAVTVGWVVLRDIANMMFILVLLVIGFGTAFRIQQYRYTALLRQLILMAVLINFSKTITGFFIDFMQVIMLTFVNAFADTAAGNLTTAVGLDKVLSLQNGISGAEVSSLSIATTLLLGVIFIAVTCIVVVLYLVIFLARIIMLWILTILSPVAYLFNTFPSTKQYWGRWWKTFWQYAMIGPVLAFFLWLTLSITQAGNSVLLLDSLKPDAELKISEFDSGGAGTVTAAISAIGSQAGILSFLIAILLLVFSLKVATELGVAGGSWANQTFGKVQKNAAKITKGAGKAVAGGILGATGATALAESAAGGLTRLGATSWTRHIPFVQDASIRLNTQLSNYKKARKERAEKLMGSVQDERIVSAFANKRTLNPEERARRDAARKLSPGSLNKDSDVRKQLQNMTPADFPQLTPNRLYRIVQKIPNLVGEFPDLARQVVQSGSVRKKEALGLQNASYDRKTRTIVGAVPAPLATPPSWYKENQPLADVDREKYNDTRQAIRQRYDNNAEAFFKSAEFKLNEAKFVGRDDYFEAFNLEQDRRGKIERGEQRLDELTGVGTATRKGADGKAVNLALDFETARGLGLNVASGSAGANLTGQEKEQAVDLLAQKMREQEHQKEIERRQQQMQQQADAEFEEQRVAAAKRGELGSVQRRMVSQEDAAVAVSADAAFQEQLKGRVDEFHSALENAESINLINKGRVGRSARQVLRHEQSHDLVEQLSPGDLKELWAELEPERQKDIEQYVRQNWENGDRMSLDDVQREFFTEAYASYGRGKQIGPLGLAADAERFEATRKMLEEVYRGGDPAQFYNSDAYKLNAKKYLTLGDYERQSKRVPAEQMLFGQLAGTLAKNQLERSQSEVDRLPDDGLRSLYQSISPERRAEIAAHVRETRESGKKFSDDDVMREFFGQALAAHRGSAADGPLTFTPDEQDMALLLHASARGTVPTTPRRGAAVSVGESRRGPTGPAMAPPPSGSRGVTAAAPEPALTRGFEAPISPIVQTNVINNTTVQSEASDLFQKIGDRVEAMPSRQDLHYSLQQLQNIVLQVAREQGITEREIQQLTSGISRLKAETLNPNRSTRDNERLQKDVRSFLRRLQGKNSAAVDDDTDEDGDDQVNGSDDDTIAA
ncbi:MAG: hypothetical protein HY340_01145 [Candidatus Kerfeldbacteria bacterium]|nr:hypothetical protein [Candidatus Kerfeldbacteria bacterium]